MDHLNINESTIHLIDHTKPTNEKLGAGMYASLMGTFDILAPINYLCSTPNVIPSYHEPQVPLSTVELVYQDIIDATVDYIATPSTVLEESEEAYIPSWVENSLY